MTVLLDTDLIPEHERVDALQAAYGGQQPARTVQVDVRPVRHRVEQLTLGAARGHRYPLGPAGPTGAPVAGSMARRRICSS